MRQPFYSSLSRRRPFLAVQVVMRKLPEEPVLADMPTPSGLAAEGSAEQEEGEDSEEEDAAQLQFAKVCPPAPRRPAPRRARLQMTRQLA